MPQTLLGGVTALYSKAEKQVVSSYEGSYLRGSNPLSKSVVIKHSFVSISSKQSNMKSFPLPRCLWLPRICPLCPPRCPRCRSLRTCRCRSLCPCPLRPCLCPCTLCSIAPPKLQFHAQDEFGNLKFGYSNINSAKSEAGNTYGGVSGGYQYVDANGVLQSVSYVADGLGFRTVDSPDSPSPCRPRGCSPRPGPRSHTPEVAEAKAEFQKAYDEAVAASA
ncbi:Cuticle protein 6 [Caligus rogercresseyi]|uniref:Cuticle protein 6 n=1 Tax=Caligus rogercresseyi TaxID=217165 RepID=A0A7T8HIH4_CALRO|nr:Cuticle protein 6 [Caligus rogercresseyi]